MRKSTLIKKNKVLDCYKLTCGNTTLACKKAKVSKSTFYKWKLEDSNFSDAVENVLRTIVKFSKDQLLLKALKSGDSKTYERLIKSSLNKL